MAKSFLDLINDAMKGQNAAAVIFPDAAASTLGRGIWPKDGVQNFSASSQTFTAATRTYVAGSALRVPGVLQPGSVFKWKFNLTKDANGTAASTIDIAVGTTGTTADTARVSFTKPAGTAVADEGWIEILCIVRSVGTSGVLVGEFQMTHNLAATGHLQIPEATVSTVSAGFDNSAANLFVGVCLTSGTADNVSTVLVQAEATGF
jgi:hypothetical protein